MIVLFGRLVEDPVRDVAGSLLQQLINWSSALLFVELNFVMPLLLYVFMSKRRGLYDVGCAAPKAFRDPHEDKSTKLGRSFARSRDNSQTSELRAPLVKMDSYQVMDRLEGLDTASEAYTGDDEIRGNSVRARCPMWSLGDVVTPACAVVPLAAPPRVPGGCAQCGHGAVYRVVPRVGRRCRVCDNPHPASCVPVVVTQELSVQRCRARGDGLLPSARGCFRFACWTAGVILSLLLLVLAFSLGLRSAYLF